MTALEGFEEIDRRCRYQRVILQWKGHRRVQGPAIFNGGSAGGRIQRAGIGRASVYRVLERRLGGGSA